MPNRAQDWLAQAERNLAMAVDSRAAGWHEWACFAAHQAAEMAVNALHQSHGQGAWGHVIRRLLEALPEPIEVPAHLLDAARALDLHYLPTRCPNSHDAGAPGEHYGAKQSDEAIRDARQTFEFCRLQMAGS